MADEKRKLPDRLSLDPRSPHFDEDVLKLDARASIAARDIPGGTAPRQVKRAIKAAGKRLMEMFP